jgi:hypothetical protein
MSRIWYSSRPSSSIGVGSGMVACDGSNGKCRPSDPGGGTRNSSLASIISNVVSRSGTWRQVHAFGM